MPRILSVQVDEETELRIEQDREALGMALGLNLTISQYFRLILDQRLKGGAYDATEAGYGEGFRAGYGDFSKEFQSFIAEWLRARTAKIDEETAPR